MEYVTYVIALDTNDMPMHAIVRSHSKDLSVSIEILFVKLSYDGQKSSIQIRIFPILYRFIWISRNVHIREVEIRSNIFPINPKFNAW